MIRFNIKRLVIVFIGLFLYITPLMAVSATDSPQDAVTAKQAQPDTSKKKKEKPAYFAKVGDKLLSVEDYFARLQYGIRQRFFHAKVPEKEMKAFRKQVGEDFINRVLLIDEAKKRGVKPESESVNHKIMRLEQKRAEDKYWQENKEKLLPGVREEFEHDSLIKLLEQKVKDVADPDEKEMRRYFEANPDKFTIPERLRVTNILLKVDPSSGSEVWRAATDEAFELVEKIRKGAKFEEMARIHSSDDSAAKGGDMGYVHKGMLAKPAQNIIDLMDPGDVSDPVILLQGVAIFRLDERVKSRLNSFDRVKDTAKGLIKRESGNKAWSQLIEDLRKNTKIEINEVVYDG